MSATAPITVAELTGGETVDLDSCTLGAKVVTVSHPAIREAAGGIRPMSTLEIKVDFYEFLIQRRVRTDSVVQVHLAGADSDPEGAAKLREILDEMAY
jgi:hypothetical protein